MSFDVEITISDLGDDPGLSERIFEALIDFAPSTDPVVSHDLRAGTLRASLSLEAGDPHSAADTGRTALRRALEAVGDPRLAHAHVGCPTAA